MQTSENGIAFIKLNEGFSATVYGDARHLAIGYGHDLQPGESFPNGIPEAEADTLLRMDLKNRFEPAVNAVVPDTCTQNQFDALADFCYNLGPAALRTMAGHGWYQIPIQIERWDYVGGQQSDPLLKRREAELKLFQTP